MKKFIFVLGLISFSLLGFTSCSDDDKDKDPTAGSGENVVNPTNVFTQGLPSQVGDYEITKNAEGLVTKIVDGDRVISFDYTPSISRAGVNIPTDYDMTMNVEWGNDDDGVDFYIKLNKQGFIEYAYEIDEDKYDGDTAEEWWFKYDDKGRLVEMKRTEGDNEVTAISYNSEGDITKVYVSDDEAPEGKMQFIVSYTSATQVSPLINKSGIMLYDDSFRIDMDEMAPAFFAGLLGKATAHLPLGGVESYIDDEGYRDDYSFIWVLSDNQMPLSFTASYKSYNPWTEGEPSTFTEDPIYFIW